MAKAPARPAASAKQVDQARGGADHDLSDVRWVEGTGHQQRDEVANADSGCDPADADDEGTPDRAQIADADGECQPHDGKHERRDDHGADHGRHRIPVQAEGRDRRCQGQQRPEAHESLAQRRLLEQDNLAHARNLSRVYRPPMQQLAELSHTFLLQGHCYTPATPCSVHAPYTARP